MALPFFYKEDIGDRPGRLVMDEAASRHIIQVLRMQLGEPLNLTDGKGNLYLAEIAGDHKKKCEVQVPLCHCNKV